MKLLTLLETTMYVAMSLAEEPKEDLHLLKPKLNLGKRTFKYSGSAHLEHGVTFFLLIFNEYSRFLIFCTFKLLYPVFFKLLSIVFFNYYTF